MTKIQNAPNRISPGCGGPATLLVPDAARAEDSKTVDAIQKYRFHHLIGQQKIFKI